MLVRLLSVLFVAICVIGVRSASATPITWHASGEIDSKIDEIGALNSVSLGTSWTLEVTFDPDTAGVLLHPGSSPTYVYDNAIVGAAFQLGDFEYTNAGGDIFTNADLPVVGSSTDLGGPGLVQFQWLKGWTGGNGGPDLNLFAGLMLASFNDVNAVDGSLPTSPNPSAFQGALSGLLWDSLSTPGAQFSSHSFTPVAAVPEPTSLLLVGTGVALLVARRRSKRKDA